MQLMYKSSFEIRKLDVFVKLSQIKSDPDEFSLYIIWSADF